MFRIILPGVIVFGTHYLAYWIGTKRSQDWRIKRLKEHAKYVRRARWAVMTRRDGLANIYTEAAARVLELPESGQ